MIFSDRQSLGTIPGVVIGLALCVCVGLFLDIAVLVAWSQPSAWVANVRSPGLVRPAGADEEYVRAFSADFLGNWASWSEYTFMFRRRVAISMMAPGVRARFTVQSRQALALLTSLAQSESFSLHSIAIHPVAGDAQLYRCEFTGDMRRFYGGVGGEAEGYSGTLALRSITPTVTNPLCLEVVGFILSHNASGGES
jgi:hypothetical protein